MNTTLIQIGKEKIEFDLIENWGDISREHLKIITRGIFKLKSGSQAYWDLLWECSGLNRFKFFSIEPEPLSYILKELDWCFKMHEAKYEKSLMERVGFLSGPSDGLNNVVADEYGLADTIAQVYINKGESKYLNGFFGCLYRFRFIPFSDKRIPIWGFIAKYFVSENTKQAAMMNYMALRSHAISLYPNAMSKGKSSGRDFGMLGMLLDLSGNKFGDLNATKKVPIHEILAYADQLGFRRIEAARKRQVQKMLKGK